MPKIAILGGGVAGLAAAFRLSDPTNIEHYKSINDELEITVYEKDWRLGGKGASGRDFNNHERIEEHGLHIWFGSYVNAIELLVEAYAELEPKDLTDPLDPEYRKLKARAKVFGLEIFDQASTYPAWANKVRPSLRKMTPPQEPTVDRYTQWVTLIRQSLGAVTPILEPLPEYVVTERINGDVKFWPMVISNEPSNGFGGASQAGVFDLVDLLKQLIEWQEEHFKDKFCSASASWFNVYGSGQDPDPREVAERFVRAGLREATHTVQTVVEDSLVFGRRVVEHALGIRRHDEPIRTPIHAVVNSGRRVLYAARWVPASPTAAVRPWWANCSVAFLPKR
jgi:uncharacterized protein with NAD-binding domain and iron-sulfur cluster